MQVVKIEKLVATADLEMDIDIENLSAMLPNSKYEMEKLPALIWELPDSTQTALLFRNGKIVLIGACDLNEYAPTFRLVVEKLKELQLLSTTKENKLKKTKLEIMNIIASYNLDRELELEDIMIKLESLGGDVEYDPESFPALIYKSDTVTAVILKNGKIIYTGSTDLKEIERVNNLLITTIQ